MACNECTPDKKPIKFYWNKDKVFCMRSKEEEEDGIDLMVEAHLGLTVPKGISDFEICLECQETLGDPQDIEKYEVLVNEMLESIILQAEETKINNESEEI